MWLATTVKIESRLTSRCRPPLRWVFLGSSWPKHCLASLRSLLFGFWLNFPHCTNKSPWQTVPFDSRRCPRFVVSASHIRSTRSIILSVPAMATVNDKQQQEEDSCMLQALPLTWDIWVNQVLPFVGMGHFFFVASVSRQMKDMYLAYCRTVKNQPSVLTKNAMESLRYSATDANHTDTYYQSAVFVNVACAEFWFSQLSEQVDHTVMACIAKTGNLPVFQWAHQKQLPWNETTCTNAAIHGHLHILKYAHENGCSWDRNTSSYTAYHGQLECLKYTHENGCLWDRHTCRGAAQSGQLECLQYAHENGCPWDVYTCTYAARFGHLECLMYAHEHGCPWDEDTCMRAARNSHLKCLQYAHENGCPWNEQTCTQAARRGLLECLRYAHENGCPWDVWTTFYSAGSGSLKCLQYAHENGCPWHHNTCTEAAGNGHLKCLIYAHENGCPWDKGTYLRALGHPSCLQYAQENGCPPWNETVGSYEQWVNQWHSTIWSIIGIQKQQVLP